MQQNFKDSTVNLFYSMEIFLQSAESCMKQVLQQKHCGPFDCAKLAKGQMQSQSNFLWYKSVM